MIYDNFAYICIWYRISSILVCSLSHWKIYSATHNHKLAVLTSFEIFSSISYYYFHCNIMRMISLGKYYFLVENAHVIHLILIFSYKNPQVLIYIKIIQIIICCINIQNDVSKLSIFLILFRFIRVLMNCDNDLQLYKHPIIKNNNIVWVYQISKAIQYHLLWYYIT